MPPVHAHLLRRLLLSRRNVWFMREGFEGQGKGWEALHDVLPKLR